MAASLAQAIGQNARRIRLDAGVTLEQLAAAAAVNGLPWTSGRVGDFEAGRVAPTLPTVYAVALTLSDVTGRPLALADLLAGDEGVVINDSLTVPVEALRTAVSGLPVSRTAPQASTTDITFVVTGAMPFFDSRLFCESDHRLARELPADDNHVAETMLQLWGRALSAERDRRAGPDANAQRKGQITRQLKSELLDALGAEKGASDGDH